MDARPRDAAWALFFLSGRRFKRSIKTGLLRQWGAEAADIPLWLLEECYEHVGDLAETIALIIPDSKQAQPTPLPLHEMIENFLIQIRDDDELGKKQLLLEVWGFLSGREKFVWNKLITGGWRVGVSKTLVTRALSECFQVDSAEMAHRMLDDWHPTEEDFLKLTSPLSLDSASSSRPYPFFLATPAGEPVTSLGNASDWVAEWKWDGIRAQIIKRDGSPLIWSRGEEFVTHSFPELESMASQFPPGTVMDGEILAFDYSASLPLGFDHLQKRLNRKSVSPGLLKSNPVIFQAYDLLEMGGTDIRDQSFMNRRKLLNQMGHSLAGLKHFAVSPILDASTWQHLSSLREKSRAMRTEGLMLKRKTSTYQAGRPKGDWFKWKVDPWTADMVLLYAQRGHGKRSSLFSDYTFGVWNGSNLVTVTKAYSGLTNDELNQVDKWIKSNNLGKKGPVVQVPPKLVFEIAFEGIRFSSRHKSGIALRFPRILRQRPDKLHKDADSIESLKNLIPNHQAPGHASHIHKEASTQLWLPLPE